MAGEVAFAKIGRNIRRGALMLGMVLAATGCQFQPLYSTDAGTVGNANLALSQLSVADVDSRPGQQVRNHLIFLLSGGADPLNPTHEVRLRVTSNTSVTAVGISGSQAGIQKGNTAGRVTVSASYEIYDIAARKIVHRGSRNAFAAYDQTNQSFATQRAERDAENRAAREVAEQLRLAIGSDFSRL